MGFSTAARVGSVELPNSLRSARTSTAKVQITVRYKYLLAVTASSTSGTKDSVPYALLRTVVMLLPPFADLNNGQSLAHRFSKEISATRRLDSYQWRSLKDRSREVATLLLL